jgi:hypothetical protein
MTAAAYRDGTPPRMGDLVRGPLANAYPSEALDHDVTGTVVAVVPGGRACNVTLAHLVIARPDVVPVSPHAPELDRPLVVYDPSAGHDWHLYLREAFADSEALTLLFRPPPLKERDL